MLPGRGGGVVNKERKLWLSRDTPPKGSLEIPSLEDSHLRDQVKARVEHQSDITPTQKAGYYSSPEFNFFF